MSQSKSINGFVRATHNQDGSFRQDMEPYWSIGTGIYGIFHWFSDKPITFDQLMEIIIKDEVNFPNLKPTRDEVASWLIVELEQDLIRVVKIEE